MGGTRSILGAFRQLVRGLRVRARQSRGSVESGLRRVLDDSASPSCCSIDKVAHVRSLIEPAPKSPEDAPKRP